MSETFSEAFLGMVLHYVYLSVKLGWWMSVGSSFSMEKGPRALLGLFEGQKDALLPARQNGNELLQRVAERLSALIDDTDRTLYLHVGHRQGSQ